MKKLVKIFSLGLIEEKHLDAKGTIDGWSWFLRGFRSVPANLLALGLFLIGAAIEGGFGLFLAILGGLYGLGSYGLSIWLNISTSVKRFRAVFRKWNPWAVWGTYFGLSAVHAAVSVGINATATVQPDPATLIILNGFNILALVFSIYTLAKNTKLKHKG